MKVEDAATANTGVWITFVARRAAVRRARHDRDHRAATHESAVPARGQAGRRRKRRAVRAAPARADRRRGEGRVTEADVVAGVLLFGITAYALFGGADFGAGFWDLIAGGAHRGARPARAHRPLDRPGVGSEPRVADLLARGRVDRVLASVLGDHAHAVRPAHARRARHRAARLELRIPEVARAHFRAARVRRDLRDLFGDRAVLHGRRRRRDRVGASPRRRQGRRPVVQLDQPDVDPRRRARGDRVRVPRGGLPRVGRAPALRRRPRRVLPPPRGGCRGRGRRGRVRRDLRARTPTRPTCSTA